MSLQTRMSQTIVVTLYAVFSLGQIKNIKNVHLPQVKLPDLIFPDSTFLAQPMSPFSQCMRQLFSELGTIFLMTCSLQYKSDGI